MGKPILRNLYQFAMRMLNLSLMPMLNGHVGRMATYGLGKLGAVAVPAGIPFYSFRKINSESLVLARGKIRKGSQ